MQGGWAGFLDIDGGESENESEESEEFNPGSDAGSDDDDSEAASDDESVVNSDSAVRSTRLFFFLLFLFFFVVLPVTDTAVPGTAITDTACCVCGLRWCVDDESSTLTQRHDPFFSCTAVFPVLVVVLPGVILPGSTLLAVYDACKAVSRSVRFMWVWSSQLPVLCALGRS